MKRESGRYITVSTTGEPVQAFIPHPLPPDPLVIWDDSLREAFSDALMALGRLDSITKLLPDPYLFIYSYVRKEAVLSSQIEGTQSSLSDLLLHEHGQVPGVPLDDVREVSRYVDALNHGIDRLREGFPLSLRLIREIHGVMLKGGRGSNKDPGEFKRSQNWIGGSRPGKAAFVPTPPEYTMECMGALEKFLNDQPVRMPPLEKAAMAHVQFETIHPFLDGNGRIGRLLITLILYAEGVLKEPLLYLSLFFKKNRIEYYKNLQNVRDNGDWEGWLGFFANGVKETSDNAIETANQLIETMKRDRIEIQHRFPKVASSLLRVHEVLSGKLILSTIAISKKSGLSYPTVKTSLEKLAELGIGLEVPGRRRNRTFVYTKYITILNEGIDT